MEKLGKDGRWLETYCLHALSFLQMEARREEVKAGRAKSTLSWLLKGLEDRSGRVRERDESVESIRMDR